MEKKHPEIAYENAINSMVEKYSQLKAATAALTLPFHNGRTDSLRPACDEHTFTENIPDERFENPYLIRVRDYTKPVSKIKMVIKGVHSGKQFRDTCISLVELRAALAKKPEVHGAR